MGKGGENGEGRVLLGFDEKEEKLVVLYDPDEILLLLYKNNFKKKNSLFMLRHQV